jgi:hypothetical protein
MFGLLLFAAIATAFGAAALANNGNNGNDGNDSNSQNLFLKGTIDSVNDNGFILREDAPYQASDRVVVTVDEKTRLTDSHGKTFKLTDLKPGQRVTVETLPVMIMIYPAQVTAISVTLEK